jgi:hypothetical protein
MFTNISALTRQYPHSPRSMHSTRPTPRFVLLAILIERFATHHKHPSHFV